MIRLNRGYDRRGKVRVRPKVVLTLPSWDAQLDRDAPGQHYSIENSVAFDDGVVYFANSAGLVQGWDISRVLRGGRRAKRVFRFWTGDDTDASIVIDEEGHLYVASELEEFRPRSAEVGQLMKLDPSRRRRPLLWSVPIRRDVDGKGGSWSTPALDRELVVRRHQRRRLLAVERDSGGSAGESAPGADLESPVVVDNVLLQGDCDGVLHAYDVSDQTRVPQLWQVTLGGCIEATPAVWKGMVFVGTRAGAMYALASGAERAPGPRATPRCGDGLGSSHGPRFAGAEDDIGGHASLGQAAGVGTLLVVDAEVFVEVALQAVKLGDEGAGEGGPPALLEDRQLDALDAAVGGRPAGPDEALAGAELVDGVAELARSGTRSRCRWPTSRSFEPAALSSGDAVQQLARVAGPGVALRGPQLGPGVGGGDVDRRVLPDVPLVPDSRPT